MRDKTCATVALWSIASFGVSLAFLLPGTLQADDPKQAKIMTTMPLGISTDQFEVGMKVADENLKPENSPIKNYIINAGAVPKMKIEATNKTAVAMTIPVKISMTGRSIASMVSRVPQPEKQLWKYDRQITLKPGQSDSVEITCDAKLKPGDNATMSMTIGDKTVMPLRFAVRMGK
jgi:hypothetical protein